MKVPHGKIRRQAINYGVRHFAPTFSRKNPRHSLTLEARFSLLFAQSKYLSKQSFCAKIQPFPIKNLHGKL